MKFLLRAVLLLLTVQTGFADITHREERVSAPSGQITKIHWIRSGHEILTQSFNPSAPQSFCTFTLTSKKVDLFISLTKDKILSISTFSNNFLLSLDDFTKDGITDFLQIKDPNTWEPLQAFVIIKGKVSPLPEELYKKDKSEFYFDKEIVDFIRVKEEESVEQGAAANP
jgi:hypothetical protein